MSDSLPENQQGAILCDMCTGEDTKPALKTCMKCEISMCAQHLQAHLNTPVLLQTHLLTEPMARGVSGLGGGTKCSQHGKLIEYYCLDDLTSVCVSCAIEDQHRLHNMKTLSTAHKELTVKLGAEQQALVSTEAETAHLEKWEKEEGEKISCSSVRLIEAMSSLRDIVLTSIKSSVSARAVSIRTGKASVQAAQNEQDTFRFLTMYSGVHQDMEKAKAVDLRKGLVPGDEQNKLVQKIRQSGHDMLSKAEKLYGSLLILVDPENHQEVFSTDKRLTFDPKTLGSGMTLSKDQRTVFYGTWLGPCPVRTLLFQGAETALGCHRWMVSLTKLCDWTIGFCDKESVKSLTDGHVYGLHCQGNQLSVLTTDLNEETTFGLQNAKKPPGTKRHVSCEPIQCLSEEMARPTKVEMFRDFASSTLSFFNRSNVYQRAKIFTIQMSTNNWHLFPFVNLGEKCQQQQQSQSPRDFWGAVKGKQQQNWKCTCGQNFSVHGGYPGGQAYPKFPQDICSCGVLVGEPYTTEILCELI